MLRRQFLEKVSGTAVALGLPSLSLLGLSARQTIAIDITFPDASANFRREIEKHVSEYVKQSYLDYCRSAHQSGALIGMGIRRHGNSWRIAHKSRDARSGADLYKNLVQMCSSFNASGLGCSVVALGPFDSAQYTKLGILNQGHRLRLDYWRSPVTSLQLS